MEAEYDTVIDLLRQRGAEDIRHPGGTLLAHLQRVERRLRDHGAHDVLRLASLAHAVYGTDGFETYLLTLDERHVLADATNDEVERLVYLYAACARSKTWRRPDETREVHDRWTGTVSRPAPLTLSRFVDLSTVNELDVVEHSEDARANPGHYWTSIARGEGSAPPPSAPMPNRCLHLPHKCSCATRR